MSQAGSTDAAFSGSIPQIYERCLGPLLFRPYAEKAARRALSLMPGHVLETAAGTGILTRELHQALSDANIVATDLNPAMLEVAAERIRSDKVSFEPADAQDLRFADSTFDLVICQFGSMFYPDKVKANREAWRVLRDSGSYLQIVWDSVDRNPVSQRIEQAIAREFAHDPPRFISRTPFGYFDPERIESDLHDAGFSDVSIEAVECTSRVDAREAATGMCQGSPLRSEIEARDPTALERVTAAAAEALQAFDGKDMPMSALFVSATK